MHNKVRGNARTTATLITTHSVHIGIKRFKEDYGRNPWPEDADGELVAADIIRELAPTETRFTLGAAPKFNTQKKSYLEFADYHFGTPPGKEGITLIDRYQMPLRFHFESQTDTLTISSAGPDMRHGTHDDIIVPNLEYQK